MQPTEQNPAVLDTSMRWVMCHEARDMLRKPKRVSEKTVLERWYKDERYSMNLLELGWTEEQIRQYDALALEDHSFLRRYT